MNEFFGKCRICLEEKGSCMPLSIDIQGRLLPTVIKFVCGLQEFKVDDLNDVACKECAMAMIQAEIIIKKFHSSQEMLRQQVEEREATIDDLFSVDMGSLIDSMLGESNGGDAPLQSKRSSPTVNTPKQQERCSFKTDPLGKNESHFRCELCPYKSVFAKYLRLHMIDVHQVDRPRIFKCTDCSEAYVERRSLQQHVAYVHESQPRNMKFLCSECGKGFPKQSHLVRHSYVHRPWERPYICSSCPMQFVSESSVKRHMVATHSSKNKEISCERCGSMFREIYGLRAHMKRVHAPKRYECRRCNEVFAVRKMRDQHLLCGCGRV